LTSLSLSICFSICLSPALPTKRSYLSVLVPSNVPSPVKGGWTEGTQSQSKPKDFKPRVQRSCPVYRPNPFVIEPTGGYRASNAPQFKKPDIKVGLTHSNQKPRHDRHSKSVRSQGTREYRKPVRRSFEERKEERKVHSQHTAAKLNTKDNTHWWTKSAKRSKQRFEGHMKKAHARKIQNLVKYLKRKGKEQPEKDVLVSAKRERNSAELYTINTKRIELFREKRERMQRSCQSRSELKNERNRTTAKS